MRKGIKKIFSMFVMFFMALALVTGCGDKEIISLTIKEGTLGRVYLQNSDVSDAFDDLKVIVKYNDGTQEEIGKDKLTIGAFSTSEVKTHKVEIAYGDEKFEVELTVTNNIDEAYEISGYELPASIMTHNNNKAEKGKNLTAGSEEYIAAKEAEFYDRDNMYVVGDDNKFRFFPNITILDEENEPIDINSYRSVSKVYLKENSNYELLSGTELTGYVEVDETNSTYDFKDSAVGKIFKIEVRPYYLTEEQLDSENVGDYTLTFEFKVVDGYNVTNAVELGVLNNDSTDVIYDEWTTVLNRAGIERSEELNSIKGIVLHDNINVTTDDIPSELLINGKLNDDYQNHWTDLYDHVTPIGTTFNFYGNYFTVDASAIPVSNISEEGTGHSALFKFRALNIENDSQALNTKTIIENLSVIGNAPRSNVQGDKSLLGGLMAFKLASHTIEVDNVITKTFLINTALEWERTYVDINHMKSYDSYQNSIFVFMGHLNVTNSEFMRAGGPLMLLQHPYDNDNAELNLLKIPYVTIDDSTKTTLETFVTGKEAWFTAMNAQEYVTNIVAFSDLLQYKASQAQKSAYFAKNISKKQDETILGINMISVNMHNAEGLATLFNAKYAQGTVTIGETVVVNKMAEDMANLKATIMNILSIDEATMEQCPIIRTSAGGIGVIVSPDGVNFDIININEILAANADGATQETIETEASKLFEGQYLDFHFMGMDILIEYFH